MKAVGQFIVLCAIIVSLPVTVSGQTNHIDSSVPVLLYHHISEDNPDDNEYIISPELFYEHLRVLKDKGYETVSTDEYYNYRQGRGSLPKKPVIITFDDGYYSNYQYAYPMLKSMNMKATIFISTAYVGETSAVSFPHFSWEEAREMENSGIISIQSHSHTHRNLAELDAAQILSELTLSKELIKKHMDKECNYLAYPNGSYDYMMQSMAENAGYLMQFTTNWGHNTGRQPLTGLKRMSVRGDMSAENLSEMLVPCHMKIVTASKSCLDNHMVFDVKYSLENNVKEPFECIVVSAIYSDKNELLYYESKDVFVEEYGYKGGFFNMNLSDDVICDSYRLKLFCLEDFANLKPYTGAITYNYD